MCDTIYDNFAVRLIYRISTDIRITFDSRDVGRDTNILLSLIYLSILYFARKTESAVRPSVPRFRSVIMTHRLSHTILHLYIMDTYEHILYMYIYTHTYRLPPHREFEVLYSGVISRFESRCDPFSRLYPHSELAHLATLASILCS